MPIRKGREKPVLGTICSHKLKGKLYTMTVVETANGIGFKVGKDVFETPTAAAKAITKNEVNGWVFWSLDKK